jgi:hypothetical protein
MSDEGSDDDQIKQHMYAILLRLLKTPPARAELAEAARSAKRTLLESNEVCGEKAAQLAPTRPLPYPSSRRRPGSMPPAHERPNHGSRPSPGRRVGWSNDGKVLSTVLTWIKSTLGRNRNYEASITSRDTWLNLSTCRMLAQQQVLAASGRGFRGED